MRAIIISDNDARALLDSLKLERLQSDGYTLGVRAIGAEPTVEQQRIMDGLLNEAHRTFHYVVCRWLQDQGANIVR